MGCSFKTHRRIAQLGERPVYTRKVVGSTPTVSTDGTCTLVLMRERWVICGGNPTPSNLSE